MQDQFLIGISHPILKGHKAYGQELLPGLAYIDLIYQIFRKNGYDYSGLELRNVSIFNPLIAGRDYNVLLSVQCLEKQAGQWHILVEGQEQRSGGLSSNRQRYITAEMHRVPPRTFDETIDIHKIKQSAKRNISLDEAYAQCRRMELVHTGLMKAEGMIYEIDTGILMDISVNQSAISNAADAMFHPAIIDGSGVGSGVLTSSVVKEEQRLFLPIFYKSFYAADLLQKSCITRIQSASVQLKKELLYANLEFFDASGRKIAQLEEFTNKLVRRAELISLDRKEVAQPGKEMPLAHKNLAASTQSAAEECNGANTANVAAVRKAEVFLRQMLAEHLHTPAEEIKTDVGYYEMGLSSPGLLEIVSELERKVEATLPPTLLFEYTTISELAAYVAEHFPLRFGGPALSPQAVKEEAQSRQTALEVHTTTPATKEEDIAIIGMSGRYPGAANLQEFWENLKTGKDCISEIPESRWDWRQFTGVHSPSGKPVSRWGGFIDDADCFDSQFFRITPREAKVMDPQERLFLETCWETIEDAGYTPKTLVSPQGFNKRQPVGVFVGVMHKDYTLIGAEAVSKEQVFPLSLNYAPIANRVSYFCNFHGPSMAVDTVCSSSLTAVHLAINSIKQGECEVALAGGVNLSLHPGKYISYGIADMHASDGYCHTFGNKGDGYVSGEGIGAVLLKPLRKAVRDGDHIYAVIKGSAINHVGAVSGITVPSPVAQADLIGGCMEKTGINPRTISYIEAHGTGTSLGDPIEIQGLVKAFRQYTQEQQFCSIGSVKSNVGHAESAAGICGLHKVALQLYHKTLVPSLHSEELNPYINFEQSPFYVQHTTEVWKRPVMIEDGEPVSYPRRAGLSSFGATGSNAHLILEEYLPDRIQLPKARLAEERPVIIPLSAKNKERLQAYAVKLHKFLLTLNQDFWHEGDERMLQEILKIKIRKLLAGIISVGEAEIEMEEPWSEYGIEPLQIAVLKEMLQKELKADGVELDQKSSIALVAAYLVQNCRESLDMKSLLPHPGTESQKETEEPELNCCAKGMELEALAYTMQVGREAMEERVAFLVRSIPELMESLAAFGEEKEDIACCWQGRVRQGKETPEFTGADFQEQMDTWIAQGNSAKLAEAWVKGYPIQWELLYTPYRPQRIPLPTYPFARESHWVTERDGAGPTAAVTPLLHRNAITVTQEEGYELMTFEEVLQKQDLQRTSSTRIKTLACFLLDKGNMQTVMQAIQALDMETQVIFISTGEACEKRSPREYAVVRDDTKTYSWALESIREEYGGVDALLYLWALEQPEYIRDSSCIARILQAMVSAKLKVGKLVLAGQFADEVERCYLEAWIGFERSLGLVLPHTQVYGVYQEACGQEREVDLQDWVGKLWEELRVEKGESALYIDGKRHVYRIQPAEVQAGGSPMKRGGTYLITGGLGGLGFLFAEHFAKKQPVNLVLTGRSPMDQEKQEKVKALKALGSKVFYIQADICDLGFMKEGLRQAKEYFGAVHGVIHAAGIESTQSILEKEIQSFQEVLKPKIDGTLALDTLLEGEPLDFMCYFSSSSAILGDMCSCDYAIGNRFQMIYARHRNPKHQGKAVAINWPLWRDGGMGMENMENVRMYLKSSGQCFLEAEEGLRIFERLITGEKAQYLVLAGQRGRVERFLKLTQNQPSLAVSPISGTPGKGWRAELKGCKLEQCLEWDLKEQISQLIKMPQNKLDAEVNLADFGFDSISLVELATLLTKHFGIEVTPALFFGHSTIEKLVQYFVVGHKEALQVFYREGDAVQPVQQEGSAAAAVTAAPERKEPATSEFSGRSISYDIPEPIAIIGMSGRFPGAETKEEFWENLKGGRNCISEIPSDRWNWRKYYSDPQQEPDKTNSRWGGFLSDIDRFDALFFEISPREAEQMDPQQRLFLEEAWHALEDAGYMGEKIRGKSCGVYAGVEESQYGGTAGEEGQMNGNQNALLPARIAYKLNLKGPNMALTTACSSGLVAVHQACQALRQGECEMALAGGVSLIVSPLLYAGLGKANMLSPDGMCCVFDRRANGLIPSEAAAVVVLKPLSKAIADKDQIYAVIKASGVNYDGKTNGITAPSQLSQWELIQSVYDKYHIRAENMQYVLSHSVGSNLGDPVEVQALSGAFRKYTDKREYCHLGSVKPLIGHSFAASGVVSLIAMVMAMKNRTIPAIRNYEASNPYIRFEESPFILNKENQIWEAQGGRLRLGAISATGISGTNVHAVIEEYIAEDEPSSTLETSPDNPILFVLSAKSREQLQTYAENMHRFLAAQQDMPLAGLAYTLQTGRDALDHRLALLADSREGMLQALEGFIRGEVPAGMVTSHVNMMTEGQEAFKVEEKKKDEVASWLENRNLKRIAEAWVGGAKVDWKRLYGNHIPRSVSLPGYPFLKERYWNAAPNTEARVTGDCGSITSVHPLLHRNTSDFSEQSFSSTFTGKEFFLADHIVKGQRVLPAVAYLEMAYAAVKQSAGALREGQKEMMLKNVAWAQPIVVGEQPVEVHIRLLVNMHEEISFEVYTKAGEPGAETLVHSQGSAVWVPAAEAPALDIGALKEQCNTGVLSSAQCYDAYRAAGIDYGPGHQGVEIVYVGQRQALAKLSLPPSVYDTKEQFVLHPSIMDSALHASIGLMMDYGDEALPALKLAIPFAIERITIFGGYTSSMWALIRTAHGTQPENEVQKFDIDICNDIGKVCVQIKGFSARFIEKRDTVCLSNEVQAALGQDNTVPALAEDVLEGKTANYLKTLLSSAIKLPASRIEADAPMEKYGIDSIMVVQLTRQLEKVFGSLPKTLFFEYKSIKELAGYFMKAYRDRLSELLGIGGEIPTVRKKFSQDAAVSKVAGLEIASSKGIRFAFKGTDFPEKKATGALDIAIIGLAGRYPGAANIKEFWKNLRDGKDCIVEIPKDRWDHSIYFDEDKNKPGKTYSKWGGFIEGVDQFDSLFFNISPREAEMMDPQERLFLECVYETLEDAGYTREALASYQGFGIEGNVGVFAGVMYEEYQLYGAHEQALGRPLAIAGNPSSIANRVSYFCNFHGPSMAVDTACSSSLTTIHLACRSLQRGECEAAIAGGVNVSIHPNKYLMLAQGKFTSSKGRCESFGQGGDGYVPGEGVGAVLLKPLSRAIADGDHIYGVIKATAINHGGKTNGYTVPNPNAQADVIGRAWKEVGIHPRRISYLEAHGTGTSLGDPIEIAGLDKAFREFTQDKQFCAIGSVKSNIGHCESAAGIAGVTKVLLQLKYQQLVPSLHSRTLNPNIDFINTPFVVQQELADWQRPMAEFNGERMEYPRCAGISSFGAGGSNAHVLIEEYIPEYKPQFCISAEKPAILVLSAKNEEGLREKVRQMLTVLGEQPWDETGLAGMAYTLQVGREAMEERLAFLAGSIDEVKERLEAVLEGREDPGDIFRDRVTPNKAAMAVLTADEDMAKTIEAWIAKAKYERLLELWVKGLNFDWNKLYGDNKPVRVSLPAYPFARERCWYPEVGTQHTGKAEVSTASIHPLLQQNTSNFSSQRFSSVFTGQEFFLSDHVVKGQRILPAVAYLEMARAAVAYAVGALDGSHTGIQLKDVVWIRPLVAGSQPVQVHIELVPEENGEIYYKIYSRPEGNGGERVVHSQGIAVPGLVEEAPAWDIKALQVRCTGKTLSAAQCYEAYRGADMVYGQGHQGVVAVYTGEGLALAKLSLPVSVLDTAEEFVLHPSLADSALQASLGLMVETLNQSGHHAFAKPALPFSLTEIEISGKCTSDMWAFLRFSEGSIADDTVRKLDIDLCDEAGKVCVRMKGFSSRVLEGELSDSLMVQAVGRTPEPIPSDSAVPVGKLMMLPVWDPAAIEKGSPFPSSTEKIVIVGGTAENIKALQQYYPGVEVLDIRSEDTIDSMMQKLEAIGFIDHIFWLVPGQTLETLTGDAVIAGQGQGVLPCFRMIKALLCLGYASRVLGWSVITTQSQPILVKERINPTHASIHGLIGSMAKEYPHWKIRLMDLDAGKPLPVDEIFTLPPDRQGRAWGYRGRQWYRQALIPFHCAEGERKAYRLGGVYVVIGGAGGIGEVWSEYVIRTCQAQVVWIGRKKKNAAIQAKLDKLATLGQAPLYLTADASNREALQGAYEEIKRRYGHIQGVVHSAMVLSEQSLENIQEEEFLSTLSSKVDVSVRIAQVFRDEPLDFVLFFSSIMAFTKAPNQSDYAAGCTFKDAFAYQLTQEWQCAVKEMNWGYWNSGVGANAKDYLRMGQAYQRLAQIGIGLIEPPEGMEALETLLAGPVHQIAFMKTTKPLIIEGMNTEEFITAQDNGLIRQKRRTPETALLERNAGGPGGLKSFPPKLQAEGLTSSMLQEKGVEYLKKLVGDMLKISVHKINSAEPLEKYGIDSIGIVQLTDQLRGGFKNVSNTLLFEYPTIDALVGYFLKTQKESLAALVEPGEQEYQEIGKHDKALVQPLPSVSAGAWKQIRRFLPAYGQEMQEAKAEPAQESIAIIGMSGRYPQAKNIEEFWENLKAGKDCITEIPEERWKLEGFFHPNAQEAAVQGKSYCKWGGFMDMVDRFDPLFFHISPRDAEIMDPQERLFLECAWSLFESAGYTRETLQKQYQSRVGVYVGTMYQQYHAVHSSPTKEAAISLASYSSIANRVSYFFNFQGPSISVDTACSSSATAIHMACESLRKGECRLAVAGGVNLSIHPKKYLGLSQFQIIGSHAGSRSFGNGDGYIPGEGVGTVLLKPLSRAMKDGDAILAVIRSTAVNHGGHSNGFTLPNPGAQAELMEENFRKSGIDPRTISYVEAAATGSALGDPVEIAALTKVFGKFTPDRQFCPIGCVKSNIGHAEAASGISQLTKVVLQLQHRQLVPTIRAIPTNPNIRFEDTPFYLQKELQEWKRPAGSGKGGEELPRRATVSSFGAGGSNVHMIVEEYIPSQQETDRAHSKPLPQLAVFSAKSPDRLEDVVRQMLEYAKNRQEFSLSDFAYTLQTGREAMQVRMALVVNNREELIRGLEQYLESLKNSKIEVSIPIFTGNTDEESLGSSLVLGDASQHLQQELLKEKNLEKIASFWIQGGSIPWELLYEGREVRKLSLPTYPFCGERYWAVPDEVEQPWEDLAQEPSEEIRKDSKESGEPLKNIQEHIVRFLSQELVIPGEQIKPNKNIRDYGADSITFMKLIQSLERSFHTRMTVREILEYPTIALLSEHLLLKMDADEYPEEDVGRGAEAEAQRTDTDGEEREDQLLEMFRQGIISLEEIENLLDKGVSV